MNLDKPLFHITCTTCQARLAVRDAAAVGTILLCPKCQSFVEVLAPPGWQAEPASPPQAEEPPGPAAPTPSKDPSPKAMAPKAGPQRGLPPAADSPKATVPAAVGKGHVPPAPPSKQIATASPKGPAASDHASPKPPANPALADTVEDFPELQRPVSERSERAKAVARVVPPPLPPGRAASKTPASQPAHSVPDSAPASAPAIADAPLAPLPPPSAWVAPAEALWRKWLVLLMAPIAGLVVAAGLVSLFLPGRGPSEPPEESVVAPPDPAPPEEPAKKPEEPLLPERLDVRWVPDEAGAIVAVRPARLEIQPELDRVVSLGGPDWRKAAELVLNHFGLKPDGIQRLYWSATDLTSWADQAVVVIELADDQDAHKLADRGQEIGLRLGGATCRQEAGRPWPHPFAAVNRRLLVTGEADLLRHLADREQPRLRSKPLERMLAGIAPDLDAAVLLDLSAARGAGWRLPTALLDVWPAGRQAWHVVWEVPQGLAVALRMDDQVRSEVALVCEAETAAERVRAAVDELLPAAGKAMAAQVESLATRVTDGRLKAEAANQYEDLLKQAQGGLKAARVEVADSALWIRVQWPRSFADLAKAAQASKPVIGRDWLDAALAADEENQRRILAGLTAHAKAEGSLPAAAAGGSLWPPETRLSWIAAMLPYMGHRDWHGQLEFGYSWNSPRNKKITLRPLDEVVNPALGPSSTEAGFPVTHYVGVAGVGEDAGRLPAEDPRAGVFGFGRATKLSDISDGAANTIAIVGVQGRLGAWGSGGDPTVRALTKRPYVNGPDGFGSGQPDGMLVGMADGSVRFVSKDVDPQVLELMATARGGQAADLAALDTRPRPPAPKVQGPSPITPAPAPKEVPGKVEKPLAGEKPPPEANPQPAEVAKIDVRARLGDKLAAVEFADVPLGKVIEFLETFSTLRITFDLEEMDQLGVTPGDPISLKLAETTVGGALEAALARRGLVHVVEGNYVLVTRPARLRDALHTVRYNVSDLVTGGEDDSDALARLIQRLVAPETWTPAGGKGKIEVLDDVLVTEQTDAVQHQVLTFCEKLRVARGKPTRSHVDPRQFRLRTRLDQARANLQRPITANFIAPTPLAEIVSYLEEISQTTIVVDWITLGAERVPPGVKGTLKADRQPLAAALVALLDPLGLAYRVAGDDTLQITTRGAAGTRLELEFYPVAPLLGPEGKPDSLLEKIKGQVAGATWSDAGGPGLVHFDAPAKCLLVLQSQPVQAEVQGLLERLKAEAAGGKK